jgi:hypothetical protein
MIGTARAEKSQKKKYIFGHTICSDFVDVKNKKKYFWSFANRRRRCSSILFWPLFYSKQNN